MKRNLNKKLTLSRETVRELTDAQLGWAAGGTSEDFCQPSQFPSCVGATVSRNTCICATCGPGCATC